MKSHRTTFGIAAVFAVSLLTTAHGDQANPPQPQPRRASPPRDPPPIHPPEAVFPDTLDDQQFPPTPAAPRAPTRPTITISVDDPAQRVRVAVEGDLEHAVSHLAGRKAQNSAGAELGEIVEFLISADAGKLAYVVVSSSKDRDTGNSLRLVPYHALRRGQRGNAVIVNIDAAGWARLPAMSEQEFGTFGVSPGGGQQPPPARAHEGAAGRGGPQPASAAPMMSSRTTDTEALRATMIRSTDLRGRTIRVGDYDLGQIEDIVMDFERGEALALVLASREFTALEAKFLVPLSRLEAVSLKQDPITAILARDDFKQAEAEARAVAAAEPARAPDPRADASSEPPAQTQADPSLDLAGAHVPKRTATDEEPLPPTGRATPGVTTDRSTDVDAALAASIRAVRRALQNDSTLAAQKIEIVPEDGKIVLRGSVRNELIKGSIERAARHAVSGATIENQIKVEQR